jgi:hypothetical protein
VGQLEQLCREFRQPQVADIQEARIPQALLGDQTPSFFHAVHGNHAAPPWPDREGGK